MQYFYGQSYGTNTKSIGNLQETSSSGSSGRRSSIIYTTQTFQETFCLKTQLPFLWSTCCLDGLCNQIFTAFGKIRKSTTPYLHWDLLYKTSFYSTIILIQNLLVYLRLSGSLTPEDALPITTTNPAKSTDFAATFPLVFIYQVSTSERKQSLFY